MTSDDLWASRIVDFNRKSLESISRVVKLVNVIGSDKKNDIIGFSFQDRLNIIFHVFNSPTSKKLYFYIVFIFLRSSSIIPDTIESPTMAAVPSGHFTSVNCNVHSFLLICVELIRSFDLFLLDRSFWSACSSYVLIF